jgi:MFS family permease
MTEKKLKRQTVEREPIPQDGGYGWVILIGCFIISFIVDGVMYSFGILLPYIAEQYQIEQSQASLLTSLYTGFLFLSGPVVAGLSNALGIRAVVIGGAAVTGITFVACAFSPNMIFFYIFFGVIGGTYK